MTKARAAALALVTPLASPSDAKPGVPEPRPASRGRDRRAHVRLTPKDLKAAVSARLKSGQPVTLLDLSTGGALVETANALRPDTELVIEFFDSRTRTVTPVVTRVLRSHVSGLNGGITYRGACAF